MAICTGPKRSRKSENFSRGVLATSHLTGLEKIKQGKAPPRTYALESILELNVDSAIYTYHLLKNENMVSRLLREKLLGDGDRERRLKKLLEYRKTHPMMMTSAWVDSIPDEYAAWREEKKKQSDQMIKVIKETIENYK